MKQNGGHLQIRIGRQPQATYVDKMAKVQINSAALKDNYWYLSTTIVGGPRPKYTIKSWPMNRDKLEISWSWFINKGLGRASYGSDRDQPR